MCRSSRRAVRRMPVRVKYALSSSTSVVSSETSDVAPPITPAIATGRSTVADQQVALGHDALDAVEGSEPLARRRRGARRCPGPASRCRSKACSGWPELEHRVVRGVDDRRDRPHARRREPGLHAERRGAVRRRRGSPARRSAGTRRWRRSAPIATSRACSSDSSRVGSGLEQRRAGARPRPRARPRSTLRKSGRFGSTSMSRTASSRPSAPTDVVAGRDGLVVQHEDALVDVGDRELARRAEHAVRHDAAEIPRARAAPAGPARATPGRAHGTRSPAA